MYTITLRRRREDGTLEEMILNAVTDRITLYSGKEARALTQEEETLLILHTEIQANGEVYQSNYPPVRVWIHSD